MTRSEWAKTPYANTTAADTPARTAALLRRHGVTGVQDTEVDDADGAGATVVLAFHLAGKTYRVERHTLAAPDVPLAKRVRQVRQAIYWKLKAVLEDAVFSPPERELLADLVRADGRTVYQAAQAQLAAHQTPAADLLALSAGEGG